MKKFIVIITVVSFGILFASCKKDYTCTCEVSKKQYIYDYKGQLKSEAEKACNQQDAAAKLTDPKGTCSLTKD